MKNITVHNQQLAEDIGESRPETEPDIPVPDDSRGPGWNLLCRMSTKEETLSSLADQMMAESSHQDRSALLAGLKKKLF